jgi:hypothetical protein
VFAQNLLAIGLSFYKLNSSESTKPVGGKRKSADARKQINYS